MPLGKVQIERLARLARIDITPKEATRLSEDLEIITGYFDQLRVVNTGPTEIGGFATPSTAGRPDIPAGSLPQNDALMNAPQTDGRFFMVPKVIDK